MMHRFFIFLLFPLLAGADPRGPEDLVEQALAHNPALAAAQARAEAAAARIPQAQSLPDPELGYGYYAQRMNDRQTLMLRQRFPSPGTRGRRGEVAEAAAGVADLRADTLRRNLTADMHTLYADLVYLDGTIALFQRNRELYAQTERFLEGRLEAGRATSAELLRTRLARARLEDEIAVLASRRPALAARLNALLGQSTATPLPDLKPLNEVVGRFDHPPAERDFSRNPELLALDQTIAGQRSAIALARQSGRPDFSLGVEWMDTGSGRQDEIKLLLGVQLPIWRETVRAAGREARAEALAFTHDRRNRELALEAEWQEATERQRDARRRLELTRDQLLPQARAVLEAEESAYRSGTSDLLNLIDAQRVLLDLQRMELNALAEFIRNAAIIHRITGQP